MWEPVTRGGLSPKRGMGRFTFLAFSPDSRQIAVATVNGFLSVARLDNRVLRDMQPVACHTDEIPHCVWSKDGNYIVTCSRDKTCAVWDARTMEQRQQFELQFKGTFCGINDSNSRIVAADSHGLLYLFAKGEDRAVMIVATCPSVMTSLNYTGDGRYLIATFCDSTCKVFNEALAMVSSYSIAPTDTYAELPFFSASCLSESGRTVFVRVSGGKIISFCPEDGRPDEEQYVGFTSGDYAGDIFYSRPRREIVTQSDDGRIVCWDSTTHQEKWQYDLESTDPVSLAVSRDGEHFATINFVSGLLCIYSRV